MFRQQEKFALPQTKFAEPWTKFAGQNCPVRILRDSKEFSNQLDIAVQLNQHFINVGPNLAKVIHNTSGDLCGLINHSPLHSFFCLL